MNAVRERFSMWTSSSHGNYVQLRTYNYYIRDSARNIRTNIYQRQYI